VPQFEKTTVVSNGDDAEAERQRAAAHADDGQMTAGGDALGRHAQRGVDSDEVHHQLGAAAGRAPHVPGRARQRQCDVRARATRHVERVPPAIDRNDATPRRGPAATRTQPPPSASPVRFAASPADARLGPASA